MKPRKEKALAALVASPTVAEAAKSAGVSERTMYRYLDESEFAEAYKEAMKKVTDEAAARLVRSMGPAVQTLEEICEDGEAPPYARVQAANSLLSHALRAIDRRTVEMSGPMPTFIYSRNARGEPTIAPEAYEEVERLLGLGSYEEERKGDE